MPETTVCATCGHAMATAYLDELFELGAWHAWAGHRLTWLHDRLVAGDPATAESPRPAPPTFAAAPAGPLTPGPAAAPVAAPAFGPEAALAGGDEPPPSRASAGSLLLAVGAFLLVVAGIAFLAFTWDLLGPFGQITVLLLLGVAALAASHRLIERLHGTATALGVVGTLLVTTATIGTRVLGPDVVGKTASWLLAVTLAVALSAAAVWLRRASAPVGELAGVAGSVTAIVLVATAPADRALPLAEPWTWWLTLSFLGGAVVLLALADRVHLVAWPWVGAGSAGLSALMLAAFVQERTEDPLPSDAQPLVVAATLVAAAALIPALRRLSRHVLPVSLAATGIWSIGMVVAWATGLWTPERRLWAVAVLLVAAAVALTPRLLVPRPHVLTTLVALAGLVVAGAAVGMAVAPTVEASSQNAAQWADAAWPFWRGLVAGLAFVAVLTGVNEYMLRRATDRDPVSPEEHAAADDAPPAAATLTSLATVGAALGTWLMAAVADLGEATTPDSFGPPYASEPTPDAFQVQVAVALTVLALGFLALALRRRLPAYCVWAFPVLVVPAGLLVLATQTVNATLEPEVYGLTLAAPTAAAAVSWWWLRRPDATPTWQTVAPAFVLAVLPSTVALLDDTGNRWWYDQDPSSAYQARMVALLAIGVVAAGVGGRQRWSGLFFPGLALVLVVVGIELVDLGRFLPQWLSFAIAGAALIAAGARWEWVRQRGRAGATWVRTLR